MSIIDNAILRLLQSDASVRNFDVGNDLEPGRILQRSVEQDELVDEIQDDDTRLRNETIFACIYDEGWALVS